ncbi:MAG: hypothetical protein R3A44_13830 [Caldilineaceae bacterium]
MSPGSDGFPSLATYQFTTTERGVWKLILDATSLNAPTTGYVGFAAFESDLVTVNQNKAAYNIGGSLIHGNACCK